MLNFFQIAKNTFRESIREPIFFILLITATVLIGLSPSLALFVFREQVKMVIDSSLATTLVFSLVAAVLCASHTITREMNNGTVLLLLSKPVHRSVFILAKVAGILAALTVFVFICDLSTIVALVIAKDQFHLDFTSFSIYFIALAVCALVGMIANFFRHKNFSSVAIVSMIVLLPPVAIALFTRGVDESVPAQSLLSALVLLSFAVMIMGTLTVLFSTRLNIVANLSLCTIVFFLGLVSSYLFNRETESAIVNTFCDICYALLPNWQFFWMADALAGHRHIPLSYLGWSLIYTLLYMAFCTLWAIFLFQGRELARDSR